MSGETQLVEFKGSVFGPPNLGLLYFLLLLAGDFYAIFTGESRFS
jgi:hypothetical protein